MKIEMEFQGLKELMKAFEDAASDEDIKEVNQKIVKQSEPVVKNIMSGKIPKSADIKLSGRGFGSKSSVTSHAADSIPMGAVKMKDTERNAAVDHSIDKGARRLLIIICRKGGGQPQTKRPCRRKCRKSGQCCIVL